MSHPNFRFNSDEKWNWVKRPTPGLIWSWFKAQVKMRLEPRVIQSDIKTGVSSSVEIES